MLAKLKALFKDSTSLTALPETDDKQMATAALLIEAAFSDEEYSDAERSAIETVLKRHFSLSDEDVTALIEEATQEQRDSNHLLYFTRTVKEYFPLENRVEVIEMLWEIAYADGELSAYEANLVRRICGLIYVSDVDSGNARKRVLKSLGISD